MRIYHFYNFIFIFLALLTCSLEIMGLYYILGADPIILVAVVTSLAKAVYLLNKSKLSYIIVAVSIFFSVQKPLAIILKGDSQDTKIQILKEQIQRSQENIDLIRAQYNTTKKVYDNAQKDKAWGITREFERTGRLTDLRKQLGEAYEKLVVQEQDLLNFEKPSDRIWNASLRILIMLVVEIALINAAFNCKFGRNRGRPRRIKLVAVKKRKKKSPSERSIETKNQGDVVNIGDYEN